MFAFAMRNDGWYLRQDIIWHKPNPMPESVKDRCTKSHEYIFYSVKTESIFMTMKQSKNQLKKIGEQETAQKVSTIILVLAYNLIVVLPSLMTGRINDLFG